jgi:hypothetical protein
MVVMQLDIEGWIQDKLSCVIISTGTSVTIASPDIVARQLEEADSAIHSEDGTGKDLEIFQDLGPHRGNG